MADSEDAYSYDNSSSTRKKGMSDKTKGRLNSAGSALQSYAQQESDRADAISQSIRPVQYHRGGKVRKTGPAILKRNERVIPASKRKKAEKVLRRAGMRLTNKGRKSSGR
jgi:hypothetical protein